MQGKARTDGVRGVPSAASKVTHAIGMDFLLECIGFGPGWDLQSVEDEVRRRGEPTAWRGREGEHLRLPLAGGLELRLDRDTEQVASVWPFYTSRYRRRVAALSLQRLEDSTGDAILTGYTNPTAAADSLEPDDLFGGTLEDHLGHALTCYLTDAGRLPRRLPVGHVLAVMATGFALQVDYVGPNEDSPYRLEHDPELLERPHGARIDALGGSESPAACMELSMRIRSITHLRNDVTGEPVTRIELDAPGVPLEVFVSPWQLSTDGLPPPKPGHRLEGVFLLLGRIVGGLPRPRRRQIAFG